jgi:hypothetical protein
MSRHHDLAEHLICHAQGITTASAAVELLCAHRAWLGKPAFTGRCVITGARASGEPYACIDWSDAITALNAGHIHGSGSESNILRIAASLGDPRISVQLAATLTNLDHANIGLVTAAIFRANGRTYGPGQYPPS